MDTPTGSVNETETPTPVTTPALPDRFRKFRILLFIAFMAALGVSVFLVFPHAQPAVKSWLAHRYLPAMQQAVKERDWSAAMNAMNAARRWAPEDPEVLRSCIRFFSEAGGDPRTVISFVHQLQELDAATPEDLATKGRMHLLIDEAGKARELMQQMPTSAGQLPEVLTLRSQLLKADGKDSEAVEVGREALTQQEDTPENLLKLARFDLFSGTPDRRAHIRERLWQLARSDDDLALDAVALLASTPDLESPQAEELMRLVQSHDDKSPKKIPCRLRVLSARMHVSPHLKNDILQDEIQRWVGSSPGQIGPLAAWLVAEGQYDRLLKIVPAETAATYTDLLPPYVATLRATERWQELDQLLKSKEFASGFSAQKRRLWTAEVQATLNKDIQGARQTLTRVFEEAGRGKNLTETLEAASLAEKFHIYDLAQRCYQAIIEQHPQAREQLLTKPYKMAEFQHDGSALLRACDDLLAVKPGNTEIQLQKLYLHVLIGTELEVVQQKLENLDPTGSDLRKDQIHLLRALSALRHGRPDLQAASVAQVSHPEALPAGQRAVFAAFLKRSGGDPGQVFRLIERISPVLLLPEEKVFLKRAL